MSRLSEALVVNVGSVEGCLGLGLYPGLSCRPCGAQAWGWGLAQATGVRTSAVWAPAATCPPRCSS